MINKFIGFLLFLSYSFSLSANSLNYDLSKVDSLMTKKQLSYFVEQVNSKQVVLMKHSGRFNRQLTSFLNKNTNYQEKMVLLTSQRILTYDIELKNMFPDIVFTRSFVEEFNSLMNNKTFLESNSNNLDYLLLALSRINFAFYESTINNSCYKTYPKDESVFLPMELQNKSVGCSLHYLSTKS